VFWNRVHYDPSRSSEVIDYGTNRKRVYDFLFDLNSNLGPILPRFRDIRAFVLGKPLFRYPSPIPVKISGCSVPLGVDPWCWGSAESEHRRLTAVKLFWKISNQRTDGRTTCRSNTALCVASHGKNQFLSRFVFMCILSIIALDLVEKVTEHAFVVRFVQISLLGDTDFSNKYSSLWTIVRH